MAGSQDFEDDPRNRTVRVWLNGDLVPRDEAKVSMRSRLSATVGYSCAIFSNAPMNRPSVCGMAVRLCAMCSTLSPCALA